MSEMTGRADRVRILLPFLVIAIGGIIAYSNTFYVPFHFDDISNVRTNPLIQNSIYLFSPNEYCSNIGPQHIHYIPCIFFERRHVGYLSFALNYFIHGVHVPGYHLVNLGIHILNGILIFYLINLLFKSPSLERSAFKNYARPLALSASLLFVVHPVQTQAVTYIVQRFTTLVTLFYLLAIAAYMKSRLLYSIRGRAAFYVLSFLSLVLSMKTKEIAFTGPIMIALVEFVFFEGSVKKRLLYIAPFFITMAIIPLGLLISDMPYGDMSDFTLRAKTDLPRFHYLYTQIPVIITYMRLIFFPVGQTLDYDFPIYESFFVFNVYGSFLLLLTIMAFAVFLWFRSKKGDSLYKLAAVGIFWFYIALSIESSIIPIEDVIAEHRVYLPSVGAFIAIAALMILFFRKILPQREWIKKAGILFFALIIFVLMGVTIRRNMIWHNELSLWQDVVNKSPGKARGYNNLGYYYMKQGQYDEAVPLFFKALERDPSHILAYNNLGEIYLTIGQFRMAVKSYSRSLKINPQNADIYNNRANAYLGLNQFEEALGDYSKAVELVPTDPDYYFNRGMAKVKMERYSEAIEEFSQAIDLNPVFAEAFFQRGMAYYRFPRNVPYAFHDFGKACDLGVTPGCDMMKQYPETVGRQ